MTTENLTHKVNRAGWPSGPWDGEPDRVQFVTRAGYAGLITRTETGHLCGYVGIPAGHPAYGRSEMSEDCYEVGADGELDYERPKPNPMRDVNVHGGITYTDKCRGRICHVPEPGMPDDVWWAGFDCAHSGDTSPGRIKFDCEHGWPVRHEAYRDIAYVRAQVESLAEQLRAVEVRS